MKIGKLETKQLMFLLKEAHSKGVHRRCASTVVFEAAFDSGGADTFKALGAAMMTLGGRHAPITETFQFLGFCRYNMVTSTTVEVINRLNRGTRIPGWGNSFTTGSPDPELASIHKMLGEVESSQAWFELINEITSILHLEGKAIYPNLACYTAIAAHLLGYSAATAPLLLVECRLEAWASLLHAPKPQ